MKIFLFLSMVVFLFSASCGAPPSSPIRIALMEWTGFYPMAKAQADGSFARAGVSTTVTGYSSNSALYDAFNRGETDVCAMVWTDALRFASTGVDLKVIMVTDWSDEGDVIIAAPGLNTAEALRGKRIACEGVHTFSHFFVLDFLAQHHLPEVDVNFVDMHAGDIPAALTNGTIDAGHTWGPLADAAIAKGCVKLHHAGEIPGSITQVFVVRSAFLRAREAELGRLVACYYAAQPTNPAEAEACRAAAAQTLGKKAQEINPIGQEARLVTRAEALRLLTTRDDPQGLLVNGERYLTLLAQRGQATDQVDLTKLIDASLLVLP